MRLAAATLIGFVAFAALARAGGPPVLHLDHGQTLEVRGNRSLDLAELQHAVASYKQDPPPARDLAVCQACLVCVSDCIEPLTDAELAERAVSELYMRLGFADSSVTVDGDVLAIEERARYRLRYYRFSEVDVFGREIEPLGGRAALDGLLHVRSGSWMSSQDIARDLARVREYYGNAGYGMVDISQMQGTAEHLTYVDLLFQITRGPRVTVDSVKVIGNWRVSEAEIRRKSVVAPGQVYSDAAIRQTQHALEATGRFDIVEVGWRQTKGTSDRAEVTIAVKESTR